MDFTESDFKTCNEFKKRFKIKSTIGFGGQAHVKEAFDLDKGENVALKILKKKDMNLFGLNAAYLEHSLVKTFDHENILASKAYFEDNEYVIIVSQLMSSDMRDMIVELNSPISECQIKIIFE